MLTKNYFNDYFKNLIKFESNRAKLIQCINENPEIIQGKVDVKQSTEGFEMSFYPNKDIYDPKSYFHNIVKGEIIPTKYYYYLELIDSHGNTWESKRFIPSKKLSVVTGTTIYNGNFHEIICKTSNNKINLYSKLVVFFDADIIIPCNKMSEYYQNELNGGNTSIFDTWIFDSETFNLHLFKNEKGIEVTFKHNNITEDTVNHLTQTINFIFGLDIQWTFCFFQNKSDYIFSINISKKQNNINKIPPPISYNNTPKNIEDLEKLFICYYNKIKTLNKNNSFYLPYLHKYLVITFVTNIEVYSLVLTVSIESLLKNISTKKNNIRKDDIDKIICALEKLEINDNLKTRVRGFLNSIKDHKKRAKDMLNDLVKYKMITQKVVDSWVKLRHPFAHGDTQFEIDKLLFLTNNVLVLFYYIVFYLINYEGVYTNYSKKNWPDDNYIIGNIE